MIRRLALLLAGACAGAVCAPASSQATGQGAGQASGQGVAQAGGQRVQIEARPQEAAEQRRDALEMKTVIGRDELDRHGDISVLDVLQRLPGITVQDEQPRMRGLGAGYTQILLNGEPAPPGFSLDQLSPSEIERIEVLKGPSAEFGGVAGTINVILRSPPRLQQREWRGWLSYRALHPVGGNSLNWGDRVGDLGFQLPLAVYRWANAGDSRVQRLSRTPDGELLERRVEGGDHWRGHGINVGPRLDWRLDENHTLQWHSFLQSQEHDNRSWHDVTVLQGTLPSVLQDHAESRGRVQLARTQLQWTRRSAEGSRLELRAGAQDSLNRSNHRFLGTPGADEPLQRDTFTEHREVRRSAAARLRLPLAGGHTLLAGGDLEHRDRTELRRVVENGLEWATLSVGRPFRARSNRTVGFVQDEWSVGESVALQWGLRVQSLQTRAGDVQDREVEQRSLVASPIAQLRWALDEKSRDVLRASVARSTRLPELSVLMGRYTLNTTYDRETANTPVAADTAGNPALRPERALALELGMERQLPGGGVLSAGLFHRRIDDLIRRRIALEEVDEASVPRWVSRPVNFGRARSSGLELELKGRGEDLLAVLFPEGSGIDLRASLSRYRSSVEQVDDPDARLEGQPPWSATLGWDRAPGAKGLGAGASLTYTPAFRTRQTDAQTVWRERTRRIDLYALWRIDRQTALRLTVHQAAPWPTRVVHTVEDLDGFTARNDAWREGRTAFSASLSVKF